MSENTDAILEPCFVLHQKAYRDTSALVEVFSRQHGRIGLVARGVKSSKSKLKGLLQPFQPLLVSWGGRGELKTLKTVEDSGRAMALPHRWVMSGFYINELLMRLLMRHDPHTALFDQYECTLKLLSHLANCEQQDQVQREHQRVLRMFEKKLLEALGYGLILDHDVETGTPIEKEKYYQYYPEKGPVLLKTNQLKTNQLKTNQLKTNSLNTGEMNARQSGISETMGAYRGQVEIKGASLLSLAQDKLDDTETLKETKQLMRFVLAGYLGDKPLHSRQLLKSSRPRVSPSV